MYMIETHKGRIGYGSIYTSIHLNGKALECRRIPDPITHVNGESSTKQRAASSQVTMERRKL